LFRERWEVFEVVVILRLGQVSVGDTSYGTAFFPAYAV
jgi:hypothetical protein